MPKKLLLLIFALCVPAALFSVKGSGGLGEGDEKKDLYAPRDPNAPPLYEHRCVNVEKWPGILHPLAYAVDKTAECAEATPCAENCTAMGCCFGIFLAGLVCIDGDFNPCGNHSWGKYSAAYALNTYYWTAVEARRHQRLANRKKRLSEESKKTIKMD